MKIRAGTKKDLRKLIELDRKICLESVDYDSLIKVGKYETKNVKGILNFKESKFFLAEENSKVIGYILGWTEKQLIYGNMKIGFVSDVFVEPKFRGKGIGKILMKTMLDWFNNRKVKVVELNVYTKNNKAYKLYNELGFKEYDRVMRLKI